MSQTSDNIFPVVDGQQLGQPGQRWTAYLQNLDVAGAASFQSISTQEGTIIGNLTGNVTGDVTSTGLSTFRDINNVRYANAFPGATASEQIAAAMADLPATGGVVDARGLEGGVISSTINVGSNTQNVTLLLGNYTYSGSANPLFYLNCRSRLVTDQGTIIEQTDGTANAIIIGGTVSPTQALRGGLFGEGLIQGPGSGASTGCGLILGGTNDAGNTTSDAANYVLIGAVTIKGFGTGEKYGSHVYIISHNQTIIEDCDTLISYPAGLTESGENIFYNACLFAGGSSAYQNFEVTGGGLELVMQSCSFDQAAFVIDAGSAVHARFYGGHFENPNGSATDDYISISGAAAHRVHVNDVHMLEDATSARTRFMYVDSPSHLVIFAGNFLAAQSTAAIVEGNNANAIVEFYGSHSNNFSEFLAGTFGGHILSSTFFTGVNSTAGDINISGPITAGGGLVVNNHAAPTVAANQLGIGSTTAATAAGGAATLPANPVGFLVLNLAGTTIKVPYYAS